MASLTQDVDLSGGQGYSSDTDRMSTTDDEVPPSPISSDTSFSDCDSRSMRSASPSSVVSMSSSMREAAYREEYGRHLNNYSEVYRLPADTEELERLHKQHLLFIEVMGGKYCPPMAEVMQEDYSSTRAKSVLDLGCGSGSWIIDVARDFPHCQAIGVDLVPMQAADAPENCRSEVDDINLGMEHYYNEFDVVHTRLVSSGVRDYKALINEISHIIIPGGLIDVTEWDFHAYDEHYQRVELDVNELGPPWWPRFLAFAEEAIRAFGGDADSATNLYDMVAGHGAFQEVTYRDFWMSSCPWTKGSEFQMKIGQGMMEDIFSFLKGARPLLLGRGNSEEVVNILQTNAMHELLTGQSRTWIRLQCVYGRKKQKSSQNKRYSQ